MLCTVRTGLVDAFIAAGGLPPVGVPSAPASSALAASCPVAGSGFLAAAGASAPANGSAAAMGSAHARTGVSSKTLNPTFLLDEALRSMAGGNFAAARARLALCRAALLAQAGPHPTSDPDPASSPGAEGQAAEQHGCRGDAMPAAVAANDSELQLPKHVRGTANGRGGGCGVEPEVGGGRDALACQLGAVCGSLV